MCDIIEFPPIYSNFLIGYVALFNGITVPIQFNCRVTIAVHASTVDPDGSSEIQYVSALL